MAGSKVSLGCLFWIVLILLVIVVILANLKTADEIIKKTGFISFIEELLSGKKGITDDRNKSGDKREEPTPETLTPKIPLPEISPTTSRTAPEATPSPAPTAVPISPQATTRPAPETRTPETAKSNLRNAKLYFVRANDDGTTGLKGFSRKVYYDDEPLRETVLSLLAGPSETENKEAYESLVPKGTKLKNIYVKNRTAYMDFNEAFRFNQMGREGQILQISQIVYTATEFTNINNVQFLIEGERVDYLGPEGISIAAPISREDCGSL